MAKRVNLTGGLAQHELFGNILNIKQVLIVAIISDIFSYWQKSVTNQLERGSFLSHRLVAGIFK